MNITVGIMNQCETQRLTASSICRSVTYILWSNDFASYFEDYLMEKYCIWDTKIDLVNVCGSVTYISWSIDFALYLVIDLNYFYMFRNGAGRGYSCPSGHLL